VRQQIELAVQLAHRDRLGVENVRVRRVEVVAGRRQFAFEGRLRALQHFVTLRKTLQQVKLT